MLHQDMKEAPTPPNLAKLTPNEAKDYFPEISSFFPVGVVQMTYNAVYRGASVVSNYSVRFQKWWLTEDVYQLRKNKDHFILSTLYTLARKSDNQVASIQLAPKWLSRMSCGYIPHQMFVITGSTKNIIAVGEYGEKNKDKAARKVFTNVRIILGRPTLANWVGEPAMKEKALLRKHLTNKDALSYGHQVARKLFGELIKKWDKKTSVQNQFTYLGINILGNCLIGVPEIKMSDIPDLRDAGKVLIQAEPKSKDVKKAARSVDRMIHSIFATYHREIMEAKKFPVDDLKSIGFKWKNEEELKKKLIERRAPSLLIADGNLSFTLMAAIALINQNPDIKNRLIEEVKALKNKYSIAESEDLSENLLSELKYLECVFLETLRFLASVPVEARQTSVNAHLDLEDKNQQPFKLDVTARSLLFLPLRSMHLDDRIWQNARQFNPSRFESKESTPGVTIVDETMRNKVHAFAEGNRACPARLGFTKKVFDTVISDSLKYHFKFDKKIEEVETFTMEPFWKSEYYAEVSEEPNARMSNRHGA